MVFYFTSSVVQPPVKIFMGLDKYESKDPQCTTLVKEVEFLQIVVSFRRRTDKMGLSGRRLVSRR